jgi:FkbM family methyltransferase
MRKRTSLKKLVRFMRCFSNWPEVWSAYRNRRPLPPFRVRGGTILAHRASDDPLYLFGEIFERCEYLGDDFYIPRPGHVVVDIGANIGFFAMLMQSMAPGITVHCFEPGPDALETLRTNIRLNRCDRNVHVHPYAVSDRNGASFLIRGANSMLSSLAAAQSVPQGSADRVETITLERALELCGPRRIDFLKVDIEGGEVELFGAAPASAWNRIDRVAAEIHERKRPGAGAIVTEALKTAGFTRIRSATLPQADGCDILRAGR